MARIEEDTIGVGTLHVQPKRMVNFEALRTQDQDDHETGEGRTPQ